MTVLMLAAAPKRTPPTPKKMGFMIKHSQGITIHFEDLNIAEMLTNYLH